MFRFSRCEPDARRATKEYTSWGRAVAAARRKGERIRCRIKGEFGVSLADPSGRAIPADCTPDDYVPIALRR